MEKNRGTGGFGRENRGRQNREGFVYVKKESDSRRVKRGGRNWGAEQRVFVYVKKKKRAHGEEERRQRREFV